MEQAQAINIQKEFGVSKDELYRAWIDEQELKQWWKPMGKQLIKVENDIRVGGKVVYVFENDLKIHGEYKEAQPGKNLVYSWNWELPDDSQHKGEYLLSVSFNGDGNKSELQVEQENFKDEHSVKPHHEGWDQALEALKQYLEGKHKQ